MTSLTPDAKELEDVCKRISDVMREIDKTDAEITNLTNVIENASRDDLELLSRSASSSRKSRAKADVQDLNERVDQLRQQRFDRECTKANLWAKMAELQEKAKAIRDDASRPDA